jgi:hypothetical protein
VGPIEIFGQADALVGDAELDATIFGLDEINDNFTARVFWVSVFKCVSSELIQDEAKGNGVIDFEENGSGVEAAGYGAGATDVGMD